MLWGDGFEIETVLACRMAAANLRVTEVPSTELSRIHGASNLNAITDGLRVLRTLLSEARAATPLPRVLRFPERFERPFRARTVAAEQAIEEAA
jgi:hypothetical protein